MIVDPHPERIRALSVLVICVLSLSSHQYVPQNYGPNQLLPTLRKYVITVYVLVVLVIIVIIVINLVVVELHIIAVVERVAAITVVHAHHLQGNKTFGRSSPPPRCPAWGIWSATTAAVSSDTCQPRPT